VAQTVAAPPTATAANAGAASAPAFDPKGKSFGDRVSAFQADALATHAVTVRVQSGGRTAAWQQKHHVAHMFAYNNYSSTTPANVDDGERTISWSHFIDTDVLWAGGVLWSDFLRTKSGGTPQRDPKKGWKKDAEPDKARTLENVKSILVAAGIGNSGKAMVSAGLKPCGEPCRCGAGRSKHLEDAAVDLNGDDLTSLTGKLASAKAGSLDDYLKKFGLHRPLVNHPDSPEEWHVESTD
jgi:hypothetical protein